MVSKVRLNMAVITKAAEEKVLITKNKNVKNT